MLRARIGFLGRLYRFAAVLLAETLLTFVVATLRFRDTLTLPAELSASLAQGLALGVAWLLGLDLRLSVADNFLGPGLAAKVPMLADALFAFPVALAAITALAAIPRRLAGAGVFLSAALAILAIHAAVFIAALEVSLGTDRETWRLAWQHSTSVVNESILAGAISGAALYFAWRWTRFVFWGGTAMAAVGLASLLFAAHPEMERVPEADAAPREAAPERHRPNIVLISIDSLRADRLGCYGNPRAVSPTIDRLAASGLQFTHAVATSAWTLPSHMSMLTGLDAVEHGVHTELDRLSESVPTVAETLRNSGYRTAGVVSEGLVGSTYGFARGFDEFDDTTAVAAFDALNEETAPVVTEIALRYLDHFGERPYFLFIHYWDVHYDYAAPEPYRTMFDPEYDGVLDASNFIHNQAVDASISERDLEHLLALYDGEIRWVDDHIGKLIERLASRGLLESTTFIVTSDHGDEFFEHGGKGHGGTLYREVMQVPLVISGGGIPVATVDAAVSLTDIAATVYGLAGIPRFAVPRGSRDLLAWRELPGEQAVFGARCNPYGPSCRFLRADREGWLQVSLWPFDQRYFEIGDVLQQHDLSRTGETRVAAAFAHLAAGLDAQWRTHRSFTGARRPGGDVSPALRERLRALGYDQPPR